MLLLSAQCPALVGSWINAWVYIPPADSTRHLFQHCALWRGNAALWIRRFPTLAPSVVCVCVSECFCFYVLCVFYFLFFFVPFFLFSFSLLSSVFFDCHYFYFLLKKDILPITHSRTSPDVVISTYHKQRKCLLYRRPACFSSVYKMWL